MAKGKSSASTIVTQVVAAVALAVVILVLATRNMGNNAAVGLTTADKEAIQTAAQTLVANNYEVFGLFCKNGISTVVQEGEEIPEGGAYTADSDTYKTYANIESLVKRTYIADEAFRILNNASGKGEIYTDKDGVLGFVPDHFVQVNDDKNWQNAGIEISDIQQDSAVLTITVKTAAGKDAPLTVNMIRENGKWLLERLVY